MKITVGEVYKLLTEGKTVKVKTLDNEYTKILRYVDKGNLDTYKVTLTNNLSIKVSKEHKFFTDVGWLETKEIKPKINSIFCDDGKYYVVDSIDLIGIYLIKFNGSNMGPYSLFKIIFLFLILPNVSLICNIKFSISISLFLNIIRFIIFDE